MYKFLPSVSEAGNKKFRFTQRAFAEAVKTKR